MRIKKEKTNKKISFKPIIVLTFFVLLALQVFYTIQVSSFGGKLTKLESEYDTLREENNRLAEKIIGKSSLTSLYEEALSWGYVKPLSVIYIKDVDAVAQAR